MEKAMWSQLWLRYEKCEDCGNGVFLERVCLEGFDEKQPIVKNALKELSEGAEKMLGKRLSVVKDGERAGLLLKRSDSLAAGELPASGGGRKTFFGGF